MTTGTMGSQSHLSVVVPAHNEERVLGRLLTALLADGPANLDVVVVCNGCTDGTAEVARSFGPPVRVLESAEASKPAALNLGDRTARGYPRAYVDADVVVTSAALRAVGHGLTSPCLVGAPRLVIDDRAASWPVRAFYSTRQQLGYVNTAMVGSGVYVLSEQGRRRFGEFPPLIGDDVFVRQLFDRTERLWASPDAVFTVVPPRTLSGLLQIKTRSRAGNIQHRSEHDTARRAGGTDRARYYGALLRDPGTWPALGVYLGVTAVAWLRAQLWLRRGATEHWERDETSRRSS